MSGAKRKVSVEAITGALDVGTTEGLDRIQQMGERAKKAEAIQNEATQIGRPRVIQGEWERLQLRLPKALVRAVKQAALDTGKTESVIVAEWLQDRFQA
jgi:hypothetical protein